jgi:hypothetical protein
MTELEPHRAASPALPEMTREEAEDWTTKVKNTLVRLHEVVTDLHDRKAHKALGFATWDEYVQQEFGMSPQRSYQLLMQGRVTAEIQSVITTGVVISEAEARDIKGNVPAVIEVAKALVEAGQQEGQAIEEAVAQVRRDRKAAKLAAKQAEAQRKQDIADRLAASAVKTLPNTDLYDVLPATGYPLDRWSPIAYVAEALADGQSRSLSELAFGYSHPNSSDLIRVKFYELAHGDKVKAREFEHDDITPKAWLLGKALAAFGPQVAEDEHGQWRLTVPFEDLRNNGEPLVRERDTVDPPGVEEMRRRLSGEDEPPPVSEEPAPRIEPMNLTEQSIVIESPRVVASEAWSFETLKSYIYACPDLESFAFLEAHLEPILKAAKHRLREAALRAQLQG